MHNAITVFLLLSLTAICVNPSASSEADKPKYLCNDDPMAFFRILVRNLIGSEIKIAQDSLGLQPGKVGFHWA